MPKKSAVPPPSNITTDTTRRVFLQGSSAVIALPFLHSLLPRAAWAATASLSPPTRFLMYYVPLGMLPDAWLPTGTGTTYTLSPSLQPLAQLKANFTVISNTDNTLPGQPSSPGGHSKGTGAYATCSPIQAPGQQVKTGISADQVIAQSIGNTTRLGSMQIGLSAEVTNDGPYASAYNSCISYSSPTSNLPVISKPSAIFSRLFPNGKVSGATASKVAYAPSRVIKPSAQKSILDGAVAQATSLQKRLGTDDAQVLDQYLTGLREVERSLGDVSDNPDVDIGSDGTGATTPSGSTPSGGTASGGPLGVSSDACVVPSAPTDGNDGDYQTRFGLLSQLLPLAFQCDQTRVMSFMFAPGETYRVYKHLGISGKHHFLSHYNSASEAQASPDVAKVMLRKIQVYEMQCFATLLANMKAIKEGSGTMLDNMSIFFSSEMSDSAAHNYQHMPVLIAGGGGGRLRAQGQHIACKDGTKYAQALLTAMRATGATVNQFGAQGVTTGIDGML